VAPTSVPFSSALVTGGSSGIGRALALQLSRHGVRVAAVARRKDQLDRLAEEAGRAGGGCRGLAADLRLPSECFRVVEEAERTLGGLDLVIANAGVGGRGLLVAQTPWDQLAEIVEVNTLGSMALVRAALPGMISRRSGTIAGISSLASYRGFPGGAAYSCSKAALSAFLEAVRVENRGNGITVVDIHPGFVRTAMTAVPGRRLPFLLDADPAAALILKAIIDRKPVFNFPWQTSLILRMIRLMPPLVYDRFAAGLLRRRTQKARVGS